jgi:hypothetical protein
MDQPDYAELMAQLARAREDLGDRASLRSLGKIVGVSATTVTKWLRVQRFPQNVDPLLALVAAIRTAAARHNALTPDLAELTTGGRWEAAYLAANTARAHDTRNAVVRRAAEQVLAAARPGVPVEQCDPLQLGVKQAVDAGADGAGLPRYVRRAHDARLRKAVRAAGGVIALVGGSSTGKSRSAWEAIRDLDTRWRVWRPGDWSELARIEPHTVIWLDDARTQLTDERVQDLAKIVADPTRMPVAVLTQMWHEDWRTFRDGEHTAAERLLTGPVIHIPEKFTPLDPSEWDAAVTSDPRLARAAAEAGTEITQYLAGAPALVDVYLHGLTMTRALITAAIDARRLGLPEPLRLPLLAEAAPGYPTDAEWEQVRNRDWLPEALAEARAPVRGLPGPLRTAGSRTFTPSAPDELRIAPYLEELGSAERRTVIPHREFWSAAQRQGSPAEQAILASRADGYGLYRIGAGLRKAALASRWPAHPAALLRHVPDADTAVARWVVEHTPAANLRQVDELGKDLDRRQQVQERTMLYQRIARTANLTDREISRFIAQLAELGDTTATADFVARHPGSSLQADVGIVGPLARLDRDEAEIHAQRVLAEEAPHLAWFVHPLATAGFRQTISSYILALTSADELQAVIRLLEVLHDNGFVDEVRHLLKCIDLATLPFDHLTDAVTLLRILHSLSLSEQVSAVLTRVNADGRMRAWHSNREAALASLPSEISDRLQLDPEPPPPAPQPRLTISLNVLLQVKDLAEQFADEWDSLTAPDADVAARAADVSDLDRLLALLWHLRAGGHHDAREILIRRIDPNQLPPEFDKLCALGRELGPTAAAEAVMARVVAECEPRYTKYVRRVILSTLEEIGATDLTVRLAWRIADAGNFAACLQLLPNVAGRYPYGREPDGTPSARWGWEDLP